MVQYRQDDWFSIRVFRVMTKITIQDVADYAGVGIGTVSRVLNQSEQVRDDTRQRVLEAMSTLGYKPDAIARQLARKERIRNIGIITRSFDKDFYSFAERLRGVQRGIETVQKTYELLLFSTKSMQHYYQRLREIIRNGVLDALLVLDLRVAEYQFAELADANIPIVSIGHYESSKWDCITSNNVLGGSLATHHLIELGHRKIGYIGNPVIDEEGFYVSAERLKGYRQALEANHITYNPDYINLGHHDFETSRQLTKQLLTLDDRPTAIFAMSDTQALACVTTIREAGLRVPEDISVMGYDDLEISRQLGLTTISQHLQLTGELGILHLVNKLERVPQTTPPTLPPLELKVRATTQAI